MNAPELLPCPFCGGTPDEPVDATRFLGSWRIIHRNCVIPSFAIEHAERQAVIDLWNTRSNLCLELVAAAYEAAANVVSRAGHSLDAEIRALAPADAQAALAARDARIREAALREAAAKIAPDDDLFDAEVSAKAMRRSCGDEILALISKDKADG